MIYNVMDIKRYKHESQPQKIRKYKKSIYLIYYKKN